MDLRGTLRSGVAAIAIAGVAAPAGAAAPAAAGLAARGALEVRVGQAKEFSRIEFHWSGGAKLTPRLEGRKLILRFNRDADPDIARLRIDPPRWVKAAEARHVRGALELVLTLADDADYRVGVDERASFVNIYEKAKPEPAAADGKTKPGEPAEVAEARTTSSQPITPRPDPTPPGGVVHMDAKILNGQVLLNFPWARPNGAAVFRRGDAVWVVFDAPATLDVSRAPRGLRQFSSMRAMRGDTYSAIRIASPANVPVAAYNQAGVWTVALGPGAQNQASVVKVQRDQDSGPATLTAAVAGATRSVRLPDPVVGDVMNVVTALGPSKGVPSRREFVQMAVLPSAQGVAVESYVDDIDVQFDGDLVYIGRPQGLALSPTAVGVQRVEAQLGAPQPAQLPALIDSTWSKTGSGGFLSRYNALLNAAMEEGDKGRDAPTAARMALARFLVGSELSFEAIGVLNAAARQNPQIVDDPEFRGLRGIARVMARRYKEAQADFSAPILADDPSSALWRSYIAANLAQWSEARSQFAAGAEAFNQFSPVWKARFARMDATAALALGDVPGADQRVRLALMDKTDPLEELATRLVQARVIEAQGQKERALGIYLAVAKAPTESLSSPAILRATQIKLALGKVTPLQAANVFDGLRYRWRGDATELETIRALGTLYLDQGRYREALEALRSAGVRMPDLPEALLLQKDLAQAFRTLFLDGAADGLEPVQALALFYDFKDLTPLGADGDMMVRKLVRRLVDVDLLDQAADLLRYQVDNRLDGVPRAQVATDLAVIYLMDRKPEQAMIAINGSRTTVLPSALNAERRLVEARAQMGLGRYDYALEVIERDTSKEAQDLRAELVWKQKQWPEAGALFEKALGDRWKKDGPLSAEEEGKLLRAGVAFSLAGDEAALTRLEQRYQGFYDQARNPEALRIALSGVPSGKLSVADFSRATADNEAFAGWVSRMKQRFREKPAPLGPANPKPAPARRAEAPTAAKG